MTQDSLCLGGRDSDARSTVDFDTSAMGPLWPYGLHGGGKSSASVCAAAAAASTT